METERIALSQRERDTLRVLHEVQQKQMTQIAAAKRLKISDRHIRRLLFRLGERGGPSGDAWITRTKIKPQVSRAFGAENFAPGATTLCGLRTDPGRRALAQEGLSVSRETLRKWMVKARLWRPRAQRVKTIHVWRERRASFGELVMQDSSPFRWLEEPRFTEQDTTEENCGLSGNGCGATDVL